MSEKIWFKALLRALIVGGAGGIVNGFAAIGIDPQHFNFVEWHALAKMAIASAVVNAILGVAMYLQKSPLPNGDH